MHNSQRSWLYNVQSSRDQQTCCLSIASFCSCHILVNLKTDKIPWKHLQTPLLYVVVSCLRVRRKLRGKSILRQPLHEEQFDLSSPKPNPQDWNERRRKAFSESSKMMLQQYIWRMFSNCYDLKYIPQTANWEEDRDYEHLDIDIVHPPAPPSFLNPEFGLWTTIVCNEPITNQ